MDIELRDRRAETVPVHGIQGKVVAERLRRTLLVLLLSPLLANPARSADGSHATNALVRPIGDDQFMVGLVTLDKRKRSVSFPASINLRDQTVEYAVVHNTGKTHESILRTDAQPKDVHLAMLLLGAKPVMTNSFGADGKAKPLGERVAIEVAWAHDRQQTRCALEETIVNRDTRTPMPRGEWIYNGSNFSEGAFVTQRDGSIVSIHIDPEALINNPRPGRENDDLHLPNSVKLPPVGTRAEITIRLLGAGTNITVR